METKSPLLGNASGSFTLTTEMKSPSLSNTSGSFTLTTEVTENVNYEANIPRSNYPSLLKVPHQLRQINNNAYEPLLISIGPYHRGKPHLKEMEFYKRSFISSILAEKGKEVDECVKTNSDKARDCYSPDVYKLKDHEFLDMMRVDGCFIIALIKHLINIDRKLPTDNYIDPIFNLQWFLVALCLDLLLLENQLPFFVLEVLYKVIKEVFVEDGEGLASQAFSALSRFIPEPTWTEKRPTIKNTNNIKHLLSLVHDNWSPSPLGINRYAKKRQEQKMDGKTRESTKEGGQGKWRFTLCAVEKPKEKKLQVDEEGGSTKSAAHNYLNCKFLCCTREENKASKGRAEWQSIRCATELQEAGIEFLEDTQGSLFDISFTNAIMKIPKFVIDGSTERLFRNLIAFEMCVEGPTYVTSMDNLIKSAADVKLLRLSGIIENMLGDDEAVAQMINKLRDQVQLRETFYYEEIFINVKQHCSRSWNHYWKAKLRHDCFYSPWALVSFLAALLVILLTIAQFVIALLPLV